MEQETITLTREDLQYLSGSLALLIKDHLASVEECVRLTPDVPEAAEDAEFFRREAEKTRRLKDKIDQQICSPQKDQQERRLDRGCYQW